MKLGMWIGSAAASLLLTGALIAQAPTGATGQCKDGTYSTAAHKAGACSGHKGVQTWFAADAAAGSTSAAPAPAPAAPAPSAPAGRPTSTAASAPSTPTSAPAGKAQAAGGGPGLVWVNTSSKVYHCYGGRDYGTTKAGKYESEASAKAEGARPAYGKACGQ